MGHGKHAGSGQLHGKLIPGESDKFREGLDGYLDPVLQLMVSAKLEEVRQLRSGGDALQLQIEEKPRSTSRIPDHRAGIEPVRMYLAGRKVPLVVGHRGVL